MTRGRALEAEPPAAPPPAAPAHAASFARDLRLAGAAVLALLLLTQLYEVWAGVDFRDLDDLMRTLTARRWAVCPFFMTDGYWLPLPAAMRGAWLRLFSPWALQYPALTLFLMRLVTLGGLWGTWRLLADVMLTLGGGRLAVWIFSTFYVFNLGAFHLAASNYSEPDAGLWMAAALAVVLRALTAGGFTRRRLALAGAALAAACLTRYEPWLSGAALGCAVVLPTARTSRPLDRWAGALILIPPGAAIAVWLGVSWLRLGDPFQFLRHAGDYAGSIPPVHPNAAIALTFLQINAVWMPLAAVLCGAELVRGRRRPAVRCYALLLLVSAAWAVHRQSLFPLSIRFFWDVALLTAAPAALAAERLARRLPRRTARLAVGTALVLGMLNHVGAAWRQWPYIPPGLRDLARGIHARTAGPILVRDHADWRQVPALQTFRVCIVTERLILDEWLTEEGRVTPEQIRAHGIGYILARRRPQALADGPPLMEDEESGWALWRCGGDGGGGGEENDNVNGNDNSEN